ncbi:hypothetical protein HAHE_39560 [Haloferula helveola]|uniref:Uncharacterized protein n=1 Tax=Haloferula helveola TaxID=490095 RepID=A0ABN6HEM5_9BACT|nr:hypothetical protein HAHE_39560 [Haloferula helveola]
MQGEFGTPSIQLPDLHRWLFHADAGSRWSILVSRPDPTLLAAVCRQMNLCCDDGNTCWMAFGPADIHVIAADEATRNLLGIDTCAKCPPTGPCGRRKVIRALAARGDAILGDPLADAALENERNILRLEVCGSSGLISLRPTDQQRHLLPGTLLANLAADWLEAAGAPPRPESAQSPASAAERSDARG